MCIHECFCVLCSCFTTGSIILLPEFLFNITSDEAFLYFLSSLKHLVSLQSINTSFAKACLVVGSPCSKPCHFLTGRP